MRNIWENEYIIFNKGFIVLWKLCVSLIIINDYSSKVFVKLKLLIILVNIVNIKMKSDGILMD